jgi:hypothetical protein
MYRQGDILLIPIPFSDLTSHKKRPVLVLSNDDYNSRTEDIVGDKSILSGWIIILSIKSFNYFPFGFRIIFDIDSLSPMPSSMASISRSIFNDSSFLF